MLRLKPPMITRSSWTVSCAARRKICGSLSTRQRDPPTTKTALLWQLKKLQIWSTGYPGLVWVTWVLAVHMRFLSFEMVPACHLLLFPVTTELECRLCLPGWILFNSVCYFFPTESSLGSKTWFKAREFCQMYGGDLAIINSTVKQVGHRWRRKTPHCVMATVACLLSTELECAKKKMILFYLFIFFESHHLCDRTPLSCTCYNNWTRIPILAFGLDWGA